MANELSVQVSYNFAKNNAAITGSSAKTITVTGNAALKNIQNVGTSWEAIAMGDVSTPGMIAIENLDGTNYVEFSFDGGTTAHVKAKAGEPQLFRPAGTTLHGRANTAAVDVELFICSN